MDALVDLLGRLGLLLVWLAVATLALHLAVCDEEQPTPEALAEAQAKLQAMVAVHQITVQAAEAQRQMYEEALRQVAAPPQQAGS